MEQCSAKWEPCIGTNLCVHRRADQQTDI